MKRTPLPPRRKPLKRSPLIRKPKADGSRTPLPQRSAKPIRKRGRSRFQHLRDNAYRLWIRTLPCLIGGCPGWGGVECAHVRTRGAGGADRENCVPLCNHHHRLQHEMGIKSFQEFFGRDLAELALTYDQRYTQEQEMAA